MEEWRPVRGYLGYEVSSYGRVRSWRSRNGRGIAAMPHELAATPFVDKPYLRVTLYKDGKPKLFRIHRLVLEAFVGSCPAGLEGCHRDGDPSNNMLANLRWGSKESNAQDRIDHGRQARGESSGMGILTNEQVTEIKKRVLSGKWSRGDGRKYAEKFDVCDSTISSVLNNHTWRHL